MRFKERSADQTREKIRTYQLLRVDHPNCLELEITTLSPIQTAQAILAQVDMINVMRMQLEEEAAGRYIAVFKVLHSPYRNLGADDETED